MEPGGAVIWFTGIPNSGKTTLSRLIGAKLKEKGLKVEILDGNEIRARLNPKLGFSKEDRHLNIDRIGYIAKLLSRNGVCVLVAAIAPYRQQRDRIRAEINGQNSGFVEVYLRCSVEAAEARDAKGLYKKARENAITDFTGVSAPYEEPLNADVIVDTSALTPEDCMEQIMAHLKLTNREGR